MILNISEFKIKSLLRDSVFILLALNMLWVLIGYALGTIQGSNSVDSMRIFKTIFVLISIVFVIYKNGITTSFIKNSNSLYFIIFAVSFLSFFADEPFQALYKSLTFVYPLLYIMYTINYLLRYGAINLLIGLSIIILSVYAIVPISFYLVGGSLVESTNIYGHHEGQYFVSNHYGWGSALFILSAFTVLRFYPLKTYYRIAIYIFLPFVFYLLMISANRAGILSLGVAFIVFFFKDKFATLSIKIALGLIVFIAIITISSRENSVIEYLKNKNEIQLESGNEGRLIGTNAMLNSFSKKPVYWFTGVGMFNYTELKLNGGILGTYHNSYWEILFGSGIFVFVFFLRIMIFSPFKIFWRITISYSLLIFPLMIIPFFEGDLTAGQFLFFPWFSYMILLNAEEFNFIENLNKENINNE